MKTMTWPFFLAFFAVSCGQPPAYVEKEMKYIDVPPKTGLETGSDQTPSASNSTPATPGAPVGGPGSPVATDPDVEVIGGSGPASGGSSGTVTTAVTADVCVKQGLKLTAPNLVFLVDNSGSNKGSSSVAGTDCPQQSGSECLGDPVRKLALLSVANDLQKIDLASSDAAATSHLSVVSYSSSASTVLNQTPTGSAFSIPSLTELMNFTKKPSGSTYYVSAFNMAKSIFAGSPAAALSKDKIIINLSDGFPTNPPADVFKSAKSLRTSGVKMITVIYTKDEAFAEVAANWEKTTNFSQGDRDWVIGRGRPSLISDISDQAFLIKNVDRLPDIVSSIVNSYALSCK